MDYPQLYAQQNILAFMSERVLLFFLSFSLTAFQLNAQRTDTLQQNENGSLKSVAIGNKMFNIHLTGNMDFPLADMADRFGTSYRLGVSINYKTAGKWLVGIKGELITGNVIREDSLLANAKTSQGGVISQLGDVLNVGTFERGYTLGVQVGKIFPVLQMNNNSGPTTIFSTGFIQHKIKLFDKDNSFPQLRDGYVKGYDRLSNGIFIENFTFK